MYASNHDLIDATAERRAIIIGGSLGGLFAATLLRKTGWHVDVYERSPHSLDARGGGIVLQPEVVEVLQRTGLALDQTVLGVASAYRTVFRPDGSVQSRNYSPQIQTSWSLIYNTLRGGLESRHYHQDKQLVGIESHTSAGRITATFADGESASGALLIGADGGDSTVRRLRWPGIQPAYAGYLAWRGLVPEAAMPDIARQALAGDFAFAHNDGSHMLGYLVPGDGNDMRPGHRLYNWVWYRVADVSLLHDIMLDADGRQRAFSVPEGKLATRWAGHLHADADRLLPPAFRAIVMATEHPFAQAIRDLAVEDLVDGRVALLGDAAAIPRPHTAASTSKAAGNALALSDALTQFPVDVDAALAAWNPAQAAVGKRLMQHGIQIGDSLLFGRSPATLIG